MKLKLLTYLVGSLIGISLYLLLLSFSTKSAITQTDPLQELLECCSCCNPNTDGENNEECAWVENWELCNTLSEFIIDDLWKMQKTKIPVLRGSSGSHLKRPTNAPSGIKHHNPTIQLPTTATVKMVMGVAITPAFKPYMVGGKLNDVRISIEFLNPKGKVISKSGQKPMTSVVLDRKSKAITQNIEQRTSFKSISANEIAYFKVQPDFGNLEVKGMETGLIMVSIFAKDKSGKSKIISTTKSPVRFADTNNFERLISK